MGFHKMELSQEELIELNNKLLEMIKEKEETIQELRDLYENEIKIERRFVEKLIKEIYIYFGIKLMEEGSNGKLG